MGHNLSRLCGNGKERMPEMTPANQYDDRPPAFQEHDMPGSAYPDTNQIRNTDNNHSDAYDDPYEGLSEMSLPPPVQNRDGSAQMYSHHTLDGAMREQSRT
jgi:hypothetical protein